MKKRRADDLLIEREFASDRAEAARLILAREVFLPDRALSHPGELLSPGCVLAIKERSPCPYVSRGGLKLEAALVAFAIQVKDRIGLDIGISTGGFTDCLLQHGAKKMIGIDVGYGQVAHRLRQDPRLQLFERTNIKHLDWMEIKDPISMVTIDLSFISLKKVMTIIHDRYGDKNTQNKFSEKIDVICLHKPQFELEREQIPPGAIVHDETIRRVSLDSVLAHAQTLGWGQGQWIPSPILGQKGNQEYLVYWDSVPNPGRGVTPFTPM